MKSPSSPIEPGTVRRMEGHIPFLGSRALILEGDIGRQTPSPQHSPVEDSLHCRSLKRQQADGEQRSRMQHTQIKKSQMW